MDDGPASERTRPASGGSVEPSNPAALIRDRLVRPDSPSRTRYELRDPFAEVTYRSTKFKEVVSRAEALGSSRFTAIDPDGTRTVYAKAGGEWRPEVPKALEASRREADAATTRPTPIAEALHLATPAISPMSRAGPELAKPEPSDEHATAVAKLEASLAERYLIKRALPLAGDLGLSHTEYRFRGDATRVAFTESRFKLATATNSPSIARSMVDVAEARNWRGLRVSGHEDFKRMVWLEASVRGVKAVGYEPTAADLQVLQQEQESRRRNRIEPAPISAVAAEKAGSARGGGDRKTVLAAIEAVLIAQRVPETRRRAVIAAASEKLAERIREGRTPKVRLYDPAAPSRRVVSPQTRSPEQARDRAPPTR